MKKEFKKPSLEVITFQSEDIITTSGGTCTGDVVCSSDCRSVCKGNCYSVTAG